VDRTQTDEAEQQADDGQSDAGHPAPPAERGTRRSAGADTVTAPGRFAVVTMTNPQTATVRWRLSRSPGSRASPRVDEFV
jgi:hypothetical protein